MDTSYAIMVTGPWGCGKSYYFQETLVPKIRATPTPADNRRNYHPVTVSLYGVRTIEDIQAAILTSLYPLLGQKYAKLSYNLIRGLFKGFLKLKGWEAFNEMLKEVKVKKEDLIDFKDLVLIFDDLERMHKELALEEFLGFINSLVENENNKVVLIANEDKLEDAKYHELKEKTIGVIVTFVPDRTASVKSIIEKDYRSFPVFQSYITESFDAILPMFTAHSANLRIFAFWLSHFQIIYSNTKLAVQSIAPLMELKSGLMLDLIRFSIAIAIEYRAGKLSYANRKDIDRQSNITLQELFDEATDKQQHLRKIDPVTKLYYGEFLEKYYKGGPVHFFDSVYDFITGGGNFKAKQLIDELKREYHIIDDNILPHYVVYDRLGYPSVFSLDDAAYLKDTRQLLKDTEAGKFDLVSYPAIFLYIIRFDNPLRLSLPRLKERIIAGIKKNRAAYGYTPDLKRQLQLPKDDDDYAYLKDIVDVCLELNELARQKKDGEKSASLLNQFFTDTPLFYEIIMDRENEVHDQAIFAGFPPHKTFNHLFQQDNATLLRFTDVVRFRSGFGLKEELPFFERFLEKTEQKLTKLNKKAGVRWHILGEIRNIVRFYVHELSRV
jgi:hypothetical protein